MRFSRSPASRFTSRLHRSASAGFTLLEILIALAIMGLLVGLAVTKLGNVFGGAQEDVAAVFVRQSMKTPLTAYRINMGDYPSTADGLQALITAPASRAERWRGPYLEAQGNKLPEDPWGHPYVYVYPGVKNKGGYDLSSKGADGNEGTADDITNW